MNQPLAERLRPRTLVVYIGQTHLVGPGGVVRRMIESAKVSSFILWGPPGVGKTTLARIIANTVNVPFYTLSAVSSGVKEVREVIGRARVDFHRRNPPLQQVAAGQPARCCRERCGDIDRSHYRESFLRGYTPVAVTCAGLHAQTSRCG